MTVKQMIEFLSHCPPEARLMYEYDSYLYLDVEPPVAVEVHRIGDPYTSICVYQPWDAVFGSKKVTIISINGKG